MLLRNWRRVQLTVGGLLALVTLSSVFFATYLRSYLLHRQFLAEYQTESSAITALIGGERWIVYAPDEEQESYPLPSHVMGYVMLRWHGPEHVHRPGKRKEQPEYYRVSKVSVVLGDGTDAAKVVNALQQFRYIEKVHALVVRDKFQNFLVELAALDNVKSISVQRNYITDAEMDFLTTLPKLRRLHLLHPQITDQGYSDLSSLTNLEYLYILRLSSAKLASLKTALPNCEVFIGEVID